MRHRHGGGDRCGGGKRTRQASSSSGCERGSALWLTGHEPKRLATAEDGGLTLDPEDGLELSVALGRGGKMRRVLGLGERVDEVGAADPGRCHVGAHAPTHVSGIERLLGGDD